jgi:hypothetical protein
MHADTPHPLLWLFMFITGIGVGPTFSVFIIIVQNSVPIARLGAATSNLTLFQQVGGTVSLAITGTIFGTTLAEQVPRQMEAAELPPQLQQAMAAEPLSADQLTGVGDLGANILASTPEPFRAMVEPFIPAIVGAINEAFSLATASTFTVGIASSLVAAALVLLFMREVPFPHTVEGAEEGREEPVLPMMG